MKVLGHDLPDEIESGLDDSLDVVSEESELGIASTEDSKEFERDYFKVDLVDLIDQPAWKNILIDLVKSEKMNPWDIDVTLLSEKYLKKISELENNNLRVPANAILACAILLKTKSKYLKLSSLPDEDDELMQEAQANGKQLLLEDIPDLMANRSMREGRVSLDELVSSIEGIINSSRVQRKLIKGGPRIEINFDTHTIEEKMGEVLERIKTNVDSQNFVLFDALADKNNPEEMVDTFLPLLFLTKTGKIVAYQEEFFGHILIRLVDSSV